MDAVRPQNLNEVVGQEQIKEQIRLAIDSAKAQHEPIGHMLLTGPAGCGKTSLAAVMAAERGVDFKPVIGTSIKKPEILKEILASSLNTDGYLNDSPHPKFPEKIRPTVLFIDEIHNLPRKVYEILYTVLEDRVFWDETINPYTKSRVPKKTFVPKFTLVGATTREGDLEKPFLDRFRYHLKVRRYSDTECLSFVKTYLDRHNIETDAATMLNIAQRGRGTPRETIQLVSQVIDVYHTSPSKMLTMDMVNNYFKLAGIDKYGMKEMDRKILLYLFLSKRPVGLSGIASGLEETKESIERHYEPFLQAKGFMIKLSSGRTITEEGIRYLKETGLIERLPKFMES